MLYFGEFHYSYHPFSPLLPCMRINCTNCRQERDLAHPAHSEMRTLLLECRRRLSIQVKQWWEEGVFVMFSVATMKHHDQNKAGEERVYFGLHFLIVVHH